MDQFSNREPRLSDQNCNFFKFLLSHIPKRDLETKKTPPNIDVCSESLVAMSDNSAARLLTANGRYKHITLLLLYLEVYIGGLCLPVLTLRYFFLFLKY